MMNKYLFIIILFQGLLFACSGPQQDPPEAAMSVMMTLAETSNGAYEKAYTSRQLIFPEDHGQHDKYKNEWWYFTGNVITEHGREFGYQFTIFRTAIAVMDVEDQVASATMVKEMDEQTNSAWTTSQIYMAHAALSDIENDEFYHDEQFSRAVLGLAGTELRPFKVWLNQWSATGASGMCQDCFVVDLSVATKEFKLQLQLSNTQPLVLHGEQGLSAKSPVPGNASYYYSYTRLKTNGRIFIDNESYLVSGESWFDHEWSTSALDKWQEGWDWFSLQLSDQTELMLFRLRHKNDPDQHYYYGTMIYADGTLEILNGNDFKIQVNDTWQSARTGIIYPSAWDVELVRHMLTITPKIADQEVNNSFRYWEGAVYVSGISNGQKISGHGYVELTGYQ